MPADEPAPLLLPIGLEDERYANACRVSGSPHDLVLELFVLGDVDEEEGRRVGIGVVRLRLPPTMVFDMILQLNSELDEFEGRGSDGGGALA